MSTHPAPTRKNPPPAVWRWAVLVAISVAMFGNYYVYDSIAPVADLAAEAARLQRHADRHAQRHLQLAEHRHGAHRRRHRRSVRHAALDAGLRPHLPRRRGRHRDVAVFPVMAAGRLIFGLGAESMIVAITVAIGQWFVGRQLGFAFGVNLSIARAGLVQRRLLDHLVQAALRPGLAAAAVARRRHVALVAVVACLVYYVMDRRTSRATTTCRRPSASDRFVWSDLWRFDRSFWYVIGLCVTFYSVIFPFRSTFAIKYFQHAHGVSLQEAGALNGYVFLAAIVATPLFGLMADRARPPRRVHGLRLCPARGGVPDPRLHRTRTCGSSTVMIGIAFSLVPAVIWPAVPYLVEPNRLGTAYGLMTMVQAIGLDGDQSRRRRIERRDMAPARRIRRLHADVVDVHGPQPVRVRVRVCAAACARRASRATASKRSRRERRAKAGPWSTVSARTPERPRRCGW